MIVVDTSIVVAFMNAADDAHDAVTAWLDSVGDELVTTPMVVAETDHLIRTRGGPVAVAALHADLVAGAYLVDWWPQAVHVAAAVAAQYEDLGLGLTDASLVALAERHATTRIATLDHRHFRAVIPLTGDAAFRLLPADA